MLTLDLSVTSNYLPPHGLWPILCLQDFPGKNTRVGCHFLLQGIFPTQGLNVGLLHCRQILYFLSQQGWAVTCQAPLSIGFFPARILEWVVMPSYRGSSWPRDWTHFSCVSCIARRFFTHWVMGKPQDSVTWVQNRCWVSRLNLGNLQCILDNGNASEKQYSEANK